MSNLPNVFRWLGERPGCLARTWLIVGKGPSFPLALQAAESHAVLSLNDAVRALPRVDIAHFIDLEAFQRCAGALAHARLVVLPWRPHAGHRPGPAALPELADHHPALARLREAGRLAWYDLDSAPGPRGAQPVVRATWFSAEAALDLLATAGVRTVRSAGVDGGHAYAPPFADLHAVSRLANGQRRFDRQFLRFPAILARTGVDFAPLGVPAPARVFVAATPGEWLPLQVLAHSIRRHASLRVEVTALGALGLPQPLPRDPALRPRTPFSFQRFLVPRACGYAGRALYLDADMLVLRDLLPLWRRPFGAAPVLTVAADGSGRRPQASVMLMDCDRLRWDLPALVAELDAGRLGYPQLMEDFIAAQAEAAIDPVWNSLEAWSPGRTALLHYTDMPRQPWVSCANPLGRLWVGALREALAAGAVTREEVAREVALGHVRPSLLAQLEAGPEDPLLLPAAARAADRGFRPPCRALPPHRASPWSGRAQWLAAALRARYQGTWLHGLQRRLRHRWHEHHPPPAA
ncbi:hypothetical protein ACT80S_03425 [Ramlibacter sp. MAHUQ-53]|uniref:hypothetical protein n=1 Tax=unclassified Ramlibacter TaxID=2617605 RepID=UPI0036361143